MQIKQERGLRRRHLRSRNARVQSGSTWTCSTTASGTTSGSTSVRVHDIPRRQAHLLCRAARLPVDQEVLSLVENIVKVRAILPWNVPPPANSPKYSAGVGQRLDVQVQIRPLKFFPVGRSPQGVRQGSPSSFPIPSAQSSRASIRSRQADRTRGAAADASWRSRRSTGQGRAGASLRVPGGAAAPGACRIRAPWPAPGKSPLVELGVNAGSHRRSDRQAVSDRRRHQLRGVAVRRACIPRPT